MRLTPARRAYLRAYYRAHTDAALAKALNVSPAEIRAVAKRLKLRRTSDDVAAIHRGVEGAAPAFDGQRPRPAWLIPLGRKDALWAIVAALGILSLYVTTLPPSVTGEDSGELITAAYSLGIPHPPGYPLWCLLAHPFVYLPIGSVGWRVAFSSAVFGSAAVGVLTLIGIKLTGNRLAAIVAALAMGVSQQFWMQNVMAEVYALNALLLVTCLLFLVCWYESRQTKYLYLLSAAYGLGLTNHNTILLAGPVFLVAFLLIDLEPWRRWRQYVKGAGFALSMLLIYVYLPIRSLADPPVDWGDPENWGNFWDVVRREQYAFAFTKEARTFGRFGRQLWVFVTEYGAQWSIWLAWIPMVGLWRLWRKDRVLGGTLALLFAAASVGIILVTNFSFDRQSVWLNGVFWIPAYLVATLWMAVALDWLFKKVPGGASAWAVRVAVAGILVGVPLVLNHGRADKSRYYFALDFGENVLTTLEPNSLFIPSADHATFPALYLQAVEDQRPDVTIADKYGYIDHDLYENMPEEQRRRFRKIPTEAERLLIEKWLVEHTDQPVYFTKKRTTADLPGYRVVAAGLLYRLVRPDEQYAPPDFWNQYTWHTLDADDTRGEFSAGLILADHHFARGREWLEKGELAMGLAALDLALKAQGEDKETLNNFGSAAAEAGALDAARRYYERCVALDPKYDVALKNLAKVCMALNDFAAAHDVVAKLNKAGKLDGEMVLLDAQALRRMGKFSEARNALDQLAQLTPDDARVFRELGLLYADDLQDPVLARRYLSRSLALDSSQIDLIGKVSGDAMPGLPGQPGPGIPGIEPPVPIPNLPSPGGILPGMGAPAAQTEQLHPQTPHVQQPVPPH